MSNLLKKGYTITKNDRIIDYNELIKAKLQTILESDQRESADPNGFVRGLSAEVVEELVSDDDPATALTEDGAVVDAEAISKRIAQAEEEAKNIIDEASHQAEQIVADAQEQIEKAGEQAMEQGYREGHERAENELAARTRALEQEYEDKKKSLEQEYTQLKKQIEPELVEALMDVFSKVTMTVAEDNHDIVLHLINGVLKNTEQSKEFVIKVSSEDYPFVINNQGKLYCAMTKEVSIDIIEDSSLNRNQCIVETDGGVFNCSLDVELGNLIKKIKLLSCL